jgi:hypothetical protein
MKLFTATISRVYVPGVESGLRLILRVDVKLGVPESSTFQRGLNVKVPSICRTSPLRTSVAFTGTSGLVAFTKTIVMSPDPGAMDREDGVADKVKGGLLSKEPFE